MAKNGKATAIKNTIFTTDKEAQYDERAKEILNHKIILAHILARTVDEFYGMKPEEVVQYIEGEPYISTVPVDPGLTNAEVKGEAGKIAGLNTENRENHEGVNYFDILFYVRTKEGRSKIIINIEIQKDKSSGYNIMNRAVFYTCRMISSQKNREFLHSDYDAIKKVYSIWICLNQKEDFIEYIHLTQDKLLGKEKLKWRKDLLNIVMIGLAKKLPERGKENELNRLLGTIFSQSLEAKEKINILENDYQIPMNEEIREEVKQMCNLSQGIKEMGREEGRAEGRAEERKKTEYEKNRADKAESRADKAENRADKAENRADKAEARANQAESQLSILKEQLKRYQEVYGILA